MEPCPSSWARCPHGHRNCCGHHDQEDTSLHLPPCSETEPYEEVDHPAHYQFPGGIEVIDLAEGLSFNLGNAVKYLLRAGRKPGVAVETDLMKAVWYIEREISRLHRQKEPS
jgi:hypothetical protein